ncbi:MAG: hypothetical protein AAF664_13095 [Planctomycetota bacterium]
MTSGEYRHRCQDDGQLEATKAQPRIRGGAWNESSACCEQGLSTYHSGGLAWNGKHGKWRQTTLSIRQAVPLDSMPSFQVLQNDHI